MLVDDDERIHRTALRLVRKDSSICLICAKDGREAREALGDTETDLILIDIHLGCDESGLDLLKDLRSKGFDGATCVLSGSDSPDVIFDALLAGADGYMVKGDLGKLFPDEIHRLVGLGESSVECDSSRARVLLRSFGLAEDQVELAIFYAAHGFPTMADLSEILGIPPQTICNRFARIERKLGLANRNQLVRFLTVASGFGARRRPSKNREDVQ